MRKLLILMPTLLSVFSSAGMDNRKTTSIPQLPLEIITQEIMPRCNYTNNETNDGPGIFVTCKTAVKLDRVSKSFHSALTPDTLSLMFRQYDPKAKNILFTEIIHSDEIDAAIFGINESYYPSKRRFIMALLKNNSPYAGDPHSIIVSSALKYNDSELVQFLFDNKQNHLILANDWNQIPAFFHARTPEMAQLFKQHNIPLNSVKPEHHSDPNILWYAIRDRSTSAETVQYYIRENIPFIKHKTNGETLLHNLSNVHTTDETVQNNIKKAQLLLEKDPTLLNATDSNNCTPLDSAHNTMHGFAWVDDTEPMQQYIAFLESSGAKRNKEDDTCVLF